MTPTAAPNRFRRLAASPLFTFLAQQTVLLVRERGAWWKRGAYLLISALVVIFVARVFGQFDRSAPALGRSVFQSLVALNLYAAIGLLSYFSKTISEQRETGILDLLRITALSPFALVSGLGASLLARILLMLVAQAPLALFCVPLGGITYITLFSVYALGIAVLFFLCHLGIFWSVVSKTSRHAGSNTFVCLLALYALPFIIKIFGQPRVLRLPEWVMGPAAWVAAQNPVTAYNAILSGGPWPFVSVALHLGLGIACLAAAVRRFESSCEKRERTPPLEARPGFTEKKRRQPVPRVAAHPLAWKEFHFAAGGALGLRLRWILYPLAGLFMAFVSRDLAIGLLLAGVFGILSDLPRAAGKMLGAEVRERTLADLAVLPITPWELLREKARGHFPAMVPPLLLALVGGLLKGVPFVLQHSFRVEWFVFAYLAWQFVFLYILAIYLSLSNPVQAYGTSFVFIAIFNWIVVGLLSGIGILPLPIILLVPTFLSAWLAIVLIRAFPATFYRTAAQ